jgi:hypothetical protein
METKESILRMGKMTEETAEDVVQTWLHPHEANALRQYCSENGVSDGDKITLAQLLGRGYRPPTTVGGWREIHDTVKRLQEIVKNE